MSATKLATHRVAKPWGRHRLWPGFADPAPDAEPIGEIWFQAPGDAAPDLLVKYLFTSEKLSVQVHPDDAQAQARGLPRGKDECWLILDAEAGSTIALGPRHQIEPDRLRAASIDGSVEGLLDWKPVKAGDFFYSPAGTIHAIGAGITLIEIQQNSDTTYRLYDYGRPRELHLDEAVGVSHTAPFVAHEAAGTGGGGRAILVEGPKFVVERLTGTTHRIDLPDGTDGWLVAIAGDGDVDGVAFTAGDCLALNGSVDLAANAGADLLLAYPGQHRIALG